MRELWGVDLPYACFGLLVERGVVVQAAPIARWSEGRPIEAVARYYRGKRGDVFLIRGAK